jgi:hypothetical protein
MFDEDLFDLSQAIVRTIKGDQIDSQVPKERVLFVTRKNTLVFEYQEEARAAATAGWAKAEESNEIEGEASMHERPSAPHQE